MTKSSRVPLIAGNWKMHKRVGESLALVEQLIDGGATSHTAEVAIAPPFTSLSPVAASLVESDLSLAAQNMHFAKDGAFTGEISALQLVDVGVRYVILGHSERRHVFGESDELVQKKVVSALAAGLTPIVCVGETLEQREAGHTNDVVLAQLRAAYGGLSQADIAAAEIVVAYEPVWAIGTGRNAQPADAQSVHEAIRAELVTLAGGERAQTTRILYGGSVKPDNAGALLSQPDIDGALVGGASLDAPSFLSIVAAAG